MKEDIGKSRPVKLDEKALSRCGPGIRRLLLMKDEEIIQIKKKDERRIKAIRERIKKEDKGQKTPKTLDKEFFHHQLILDPHPFLGPVIIDKVKRIKIRAIVNFGGNIDDLRAMGIEVRSQIHDVFTIRVAKQQLAHLATQPATRRIKLPRKFYPLLRDATPAAETDQVHSQGNEGNGVIVGVIDTMLEVRHHAFRDPTGTHDTRVRFLWVQEPDAGGKGDSPEEYYKTCVQCNLYDTCNYASPNFTGLNNGIVYEDFAINRALREETPYGTDNGLIARTPGFAEHGTHVAGIAAGSGHFDNWATPPVDIGAAPQADITFVAIDGFEDSLIDALSFIYAIADRYKQPAIINVSLGSHRGPHDGKSDYDLARDALLFSFCGRSMVFSAGNDNDNNAFRRGTITAGQTEPLWTLTPIVGPLAPPARVLLDIWYRGPQLDCRVHRGVNNTGWITAGNEYDSIWGSDGQVGGFDIAVYRDFESRTSLRNILVFLPATLAVNWDIELRNPGTVDVNYWAWVGSRTATLQGAVQGELTLADTACSKGILTVGACAKQLGGNPELITDYSGRGPTWDGRIKPEITAVGGIDNTPAFPNNEVQSAESRTTGGYVGDSGTSMAAPLVAGSIALLLENHPNLNQDAIKALLTQTANRDGLDIDASALGYDPLERNAYGFGRLRMLDPFLHAPPLVDVDVWVRKADDDYGTEPYLGDFLGNAPEIKVLDSGGNERTIINWEQEYRVQVRIHNLGDHIAIKTLVKLMFSRPWAVPDDWTPCKDPYGNEIEEVVDIPPLDYVDLEFRQRWKTPEKTDRTTLPLDIDRCLIVVLDQESDKMDYTLGDPWERNIKGTNNVALLDLLIF